ncbi:MAG: isoaspartyl peptidase/L-asparaginase [Gammaproteobacteria bacterium]|nr:isoaspartyl peptidase/L-asparaginase [Gammaproteobacteria bacterium]
MADTKMAPAIVIHGGAGVILKERMTDEVEAAYRKMLAASVTAGYEVLKNGGSSTDAVIASIIVMEDSELFNAGKGAVFTHEETVELDASVMRGSDLQAGAVGGVKKIRNPVKLAADVMNLSPHVMLMGEGAEFFAKENGYELVDNSYFHTKRRLNQLRKLLGKDEVSALSETEHDDYEIDENKLGTVGAVAIDQEGTIAAATSTGGMTNKRFGRIGDSPIIGAGTYADNSSCGISGTGHGEFFMRAAVAHDICARVSYKGISLQQAADEVIQDKLAEMGGDGGVIGLDPEGNIIYSFNTPGMYRAAIDREGKLTVMLFKED